MITRLEQGQKRSGDSGHASREAYRARALLHLGDFGLQRCRCRRTLARVVVAALDRALKHAYQVFHTLVTILHRGVNRLVNPAVLHAKMLVSVNVFCGESGRRHGFCSVRSLHFKVIVESGVRHISAPRNDTSAI